MDRLTWQPVNYHGYYILKNGIEGMDGIQRLAAYENTNIEPAEVEALKQYNDEFKKALEIAGIHLSKLLPPTTMEDWVNCFISQAKEQMQNA